ncbi:hypothetical protein HYH03_011410 [Edaphochlamys debaryana]|uniref:Uncharacterized protein n=1 Tax=Edaphochlamys debaryana TaxID=47281 RepID=A0A836BWG9_9CHLO|nr:hypothetical protein HYH03_011410 [Edaphochlamys debaryana]|eukprot:KAG2490104.1 hypothetical protein HYH03_011410 [Edaphochlamys debaryana]
MLSAAAPSCHLLECSSNRSSGSASPSSPCLVTPSPLFGGRGARPAARSMEAGTSFLDLAASARSATAVGVLSPRTAAFQPAGKGAGVSMSAGAPADAHRPALSPRQPEAPFSSGSGAAHACTFSGSAGRSARIMRATDCASAFCSPLRPFLAPMGSGSAPCSPLMHYGGGSQESNASSSPLCASSFSPGHVHTLPRAARQHWERHNHHLYHMRWLQQQQISRSHLGFRGQGSLTASPEPPPASSAAALDRSGPSPTSSQGHVLTSISALLGSASKENLPRVAEEAEVSEGGGEGPDLSARAEGLGCSLGEGCSPGAGYSPAPEADAAERFGMTLELLRHTVELQQQLVARVNEVTSLRLQLEESASSRDELAQALLGAQEWGLHLERRLEHEARSRGALVSQSQLLQQLLQETGEALLQFGHQQAGRQGSPAERAARDAVALAAAASAARQSAASACTTPSAGAAPADPFRCSNCGHVGGSTPGSAGGTRASSSNGGGERGESPMVAALRKENDQLTQRLIASSLAVAEAREREEQARHEARVLQELNAQVVNTVHALSLELSLLRPNVAAPNSARSRFHLPGFLGGKGD